MRTFSTHFAASIAASGLKWISATVLKRIAAIVHENRNVRRLEQRRNRAAVLWRLRVFRRRLRFELIELLPDKRQILHVEERDVEHVTDNEHRTARLNHLKHAH